MDHTTGSEDTMEEEVDEQWSKQLRDLQLISTGMDLAASELWAVQGNVSALEDAAKYLGDVSLLVLKGKRALDAACRDVTSHELAIKKCQPACDARLRQCDDEIEEKKMTQEREHSKRMKELEYRFEQCQLKMDRDHDERSRELDRQEIKIGKDGLKLKQDEIESTKKLQSKKDEVNEAETASLKKISDAETASLKKVHDAEMASLKRVNEAEKASLEEVNEAEKASLTKVNEAETASMDNIDEAEKEMLQKVKELDEEVKHQREIVEERESVCDGADGKLIEARTKLGDAKRKEQTASNMLTLASRMKRDAMVKEDLLETICPSDVGADSLVIENARLTEANKRMEDELQRLRAFQLSMVRMPGVGRGSTSDGDAAEQPKRKKKDGTGSQRQQAGAGGPAVSSSSSSGPQQVPEVPTPAATPDITVGGRSTRRDPVAGQSTAEKPRPVAVPKPPKYKPAVKVTAARVYSLEQLCREKDIQFEWKGTRAPAVDLMKYPEVWRRLEYKLQGLLTEDGATKLYSTKGDAKCVMERVYDVRRALKLAQGREKFACDYGEGEGIACVHVKKDEAPTIVPREDAENVGKVGDPDFWAAAWDFGHAPASEAG
ncbi:hypothetical protein LTR27_011157 [Elasticomyces elasticus]|nr:hypothetical protein LTR27_011157 [Elasticomyces elasticus]